MKRIFSLLLVSLSIAAPAYSAGISARVEECEGGSRFVPPAIPAAIVTSVVNTLIGSAITSVVNYLNTQRAVTYSAVVPVENASELIFTGTGESRCLYISSTSLNGVKLSDFPSIRANSKFFASIALKPSVSTSDPVFRPVIRSWTYKDFLERNCPVFRNCSRRDVVMKLTFESPSSPASNGSILAEPLGVSLVNIHRNALDNALVAGSDLPWVKYSGSLSGPVNVRFTLTETSNPNQFTTALAAALNSQKANIQTAVTNPSEARRNAINNAETAFDKYLAARNDALNTYELYKRSVDQESRQRYIAQYNAKRALAEVLKKEAFILYSQAGLSMPDFLLP